MQYFVYGGSNLIRIFRSTNHWPDVTRDRRQDVVLRHRPNDHRHQRIKRFKIMFVGVRHNLSPVPWELKIVRDDR
ncbi:hypothetical protein ACFW0P_16605 [Lysobacter soli]|uniref:hypothetical protein n=1 Tax=Lysobacter soli TaxID=453783 RepID=UPI0036B74CF7